MLVRAIGVAVALFSLSGTLPNRHSRPQIVGISFIRLKALDFNKSKAFYSRVIGLPAGIGDCRGLKNPCFAISSRQYVELIQANAGTGNSFLATVGFAVSDLGEMRSYLLDRGVRPSEITSGRNGLRTFEVMDPEQNRIAFVEASPGPAFAQKQNQVSRRIFHAGWVVKNLDAERRFYCDVLGFRLYWYGGFKDTDIDWYEIQVPNGDDWVEFMLNIPANADHKELGIQNHFSLGVLDIKAAEAKLRSNGLPKGSGPEIGRDGKWSFDIYDPDGTRVEFMEPRNVTAPCCHKYSAPHPSL